MKLRANSVIGLQCRDLLLTSQDECGAELVGVGSAGPGRVVPARAQYRGRKARERTLYGLAPQSRTERRLR